MQLDLLNALENTPAWERVDAPDAEIRFAPLFLDSDAASLHLNELLSTIPWRQDQIKTYGKTHALPRLQQWYGEPGMTYVWSGIEMRPEPWFPTLRNLKKKIEDATRSTYNSLLANLYRDGNDTVGWHADDEPELGERPTIASLSLGAPRDFILRHKHLPHAAKIKITLTHGSLLVMSGATQSNWQHTVPRRSAIQVPRINLTLRNQSPNRRRLSER